MKIGLTNTTRSILLLGFPVQQYIEYGSRGDYGDGFYRRRYRLELYGNWWFYDRKTKAGRFLNPLRDKGST